MSRNSFIPALMLTCVVCTASCDGGVDRPETSSDDTEINLVISDPATAAEELALLIDYVSYRINCPSSGEIPGYDDSVGISGVFEAAVDESPGVWALVSDLPLSNCTIALWVFYQDELVCSGSQPIVIAPDGDAAAPNKVDLVLECSLSVIPPSGDLDIDGSFNLVHGNYCPQLFWLGAFPTPGDPSGFKSSPAIGSAQSRFGSTRPPRRNG